MCGWVNRWVDSVNVRKQTRQCVYMSMQETWVELGSAPLRVDVNELWGRPLRANTKRKGTGENVRPANKKPRPPDAEPADPIEDQPADDGEDADDNDDSERGDDGEDLGARIQGKITA